MRAYLELDGYRDAQTHPNIWIGGLSLICFSRDSRLYWRKQGGQLDSGLLDTGEVVQKAPNTLLKYGDLSGADCVGVTGGIEMSDTVENITTMSVACNISSYHGSTFRALDAITAGD